MTALLVAVGGAFGALARWAVGGWMQDAVGPAFPWGTLTVNVTGSLLLGVVLRVLEGAPADGALRALVAVGFLGAFTTFSTFGWEAVALARDGEWARAAGYVGGSVVLGLAGVLIGLAAGGALMPRGG